MRLADLAGTRIARRYVLVTAYGEGATGFAFAARDGDGREVVARLIARGRVSDEEVSRTIQIATKLAALGDPRIVAPLDVAHDLERGLLVLVREPMRGFDVGTIVEALGPIEPPAAIALVAEVCAGVAAAQAAGVNPLGIRPSNVFVQAGAGDALAVRVCDFAVSTGLGAVDDVQALGGILHALLSGRPPQVGVSLREHAPWVASRIIALVDAALAPRRGPHLATAAMLGEALRGVGAGPLRASELVPLAPLTRASHSSVPDAHERGEPRPTAANDPLLGHRLGGRYAIVRALGHGGMGSVYEVVDDEGNAYAAKIVARREGDETRLFARFMREAQSAIRIADRHAVRTIELGTDMTFGFPFMVMELLHGRDLAAVLRETGALDPIVATRIFVQAARGLAAAHRAGVVHRDIKPANLFLSTDGSGEVTVKVCDFGLAKPIETDAEPLAADLTGVGTIVGTPAYMSPEQAAGFRGIDARSDVFSLAASLYEALGGRRPWATYDATGAELLRVVSSGDPEPLERIAPHLAPGLVAIVRRGLAHDRRARFADADEMARALLEHAEGGDAVTLGDLHARVLPKDAASAPAVSLSSSVAAASPHPLSTEAIEAPIARRRNDPIEPSASRLPRSPRRVLGVMVALLALGGAGAFVLTRGRVGGSHGDASPSAAAAGARCTDDARCAKSLDRPARCSRSGACVALESEDCVVHFPKSDPRGERTIWIGAMFPRTGDGVASLWDPAVKSVELALADFDGVLSSTPGWRPVGLIACDDADDARAARSARHLVEDLAVPAVIGFRSSDELLALAGTELIPHGALAIATFNKSALLASIPHPPGSPRLVWRLAPSNAEDAAPIAGLVSGVLEPAIRAQGLGPHAPLRVSLVRPASATGIGLEDALLASLRYNGRSMADNRDDFQEIVFDESSPAPVAAFVDKLVAFRPHVVVYVGDAIAGALPDGVERRWRGGSRPRYVFGGPLQNDALLHVVEARRELAGRVLGISVPAAAVANVKLAAHFNETFGAELTATNTTPNAYDAGFLVAYAALAAGDGPVTGAAMSRAIDRLLPPGEQIEVGPAPVLHAYGILSSGGNVDLVGASGPLDFDRRTGEALFDYVFECLTLHDGRARRVESDLRFDVATRAVTGTLACP